MRFPYTVHSESVTTTEEVGQELARYIAGDKDAPRFVAMFGDLGVGKTAFVRGFCSVLCRDCAVRSPTFALVNDYKCSHDSIGRVYHFDMYRITGEDDLYSIGFFDYLDSGEICIAEWCELIPYALPEEYIKVDIAKTDDGNGRDINISKVI